MKTQVVKATSPAAPAASPPTRGAAILRPFCRIAQSIARMSTTPANSRAGLMADFTISIVLLCAGLRRHDVHPLAALVTLLSGMLLFSFVEYCFHRWLFHGPVRVTEEGHRKHHEQPLGYDSLPFFVSPLLILGLAGLLAVAVSTTFALLLAGALAAGYATYGLSHLVIHIRRFQHPLARRWAAAHHIHHCHPEANFGVTTPLWDILLGTRYVSKQKLRAS
ncbi:sterol desaturase family protein [Dokdonella soli]